MAAGDAVVKGTNDFTEQGQRRKWMRNRGWRNVRSWMGPRDDTKIDALVEELVLAGAEDIEISEDWPTIITAAFPSIGDTVSTGVQDVDAVTEWSLDPYELDKSLGTHGIFNGSGSSATALAAIDQDLRAGNGFGKDYEDIYPSIGEFNEYAKLRGVGVDSYLTFGYVLRKTVTCERDNIFVRTWQQSAQNIGQIVSWNALAVPAAAQIERPWVHLYAASIWTGLTYKTKSPGNWADVYFDEWMVKPPAIRYRREGRVRKRELCQEFIGALAWSTTLYDGGKGSP